MTTHSEPCSTCDGTGSIWSNDTGKLEDCPTCDGSGVVQVEDKPEPEEDNKKK